MALKHFVLGGKNIAYSDTGAGAETVILVHCSGASHSVFKQLINVLSERYRVLAPDLAGYGASEAWPANESFDYHFDVALVQRLIALCRTPVHLIGYSYGGFLALETGASGQSVRSMVLLEPVALQLLRSGDHQRLQNEISAMGDRVVKFAKRGKLRRAASSYMSYWGGRMRWLLAPGRVKNAVQNTVHKTAMEFSSGYNAASDPELYRRIDCPVLLIGGSRTRDSAKAVLTILNQAISRSQCVWLKGASHLTLLKHNEIIGVINRWLEQTAEMTHSREAVEVESTLESQ